MGGVHAKPGKVMGHAGAWAAPGENNAETKYKILEDAGITMVNHPAKFGNVMKGLLDSSGRNVQDIVSATHAHDEHRSANTNLPAQVSCQPTQRLPYHATNHEN